jgi:hypothetical protein
LTQAGVRRTSGTGGRGADDIEGAIDDLYQRPLTEFTSARNALAKTLPPAEAGRLKKFTKPTPPAWIINQVYWRSRSVYQRLIEAGTALRTSQLNVLAGGGRDRLQRATEVHRKAVADALHQALRHAAAAGLRPQPDSLSRSLEALSLAAAPPDPPGRLTDVIAPAGFEALTGVIVTASVAAAGIPAATTVEPPPAEADIQAHVAHGAHESQAADHRRHAEPDEHHAQDELRAAVARATAELAAARDAERTALARVEQAEQATRAAEAALETIRRDLATAHAAARDAARVRQEAEQALALAKAEMHP